MKFQFLLWILGRLFIRAAKHNRFFIDLIADVNKVFQLTTVDGKPVRYFEFSGGRVRTAAQQHPAPDLKIVFKSADYGFRALTARDKSFFLQGINNRSIRIQGYFPSLFVFQQLAAALKTKRHHVSGKYNTIGFVGTGLIGSPMARCLGRAGFKVYAFDVNPEAMKTIAQKNVTACGSLSDLRQCQTVIVMVNTMDQVREVVENLAVVMPKTGAIPVLVMSTVSPDEIIKLKQQIQTEDASHLILLDAPVSGAPILAEAGQLAIMVGGGKKEFDDLLPLLQAIGHSEKIMHAGPTGSGAAMKLVNNMISINNALALLEALNVGLAKKLPLDLMIQVINSGSGKNFLTEQWPLTQKMLALILEDNTFNAKEALFATGEKDLYTAKQWAANSGMPVFGTEKAIEQIKSIDPSEFAVSLKKLVHGTV